MKTNEFAITIFCDLDGVLADFDKRVKEITGKLPHQLSQKEMWPQLSDKIIEPGSHYHEILSFINRGEDLPRRLVERAKSFRLLTAIELLDAKTFLLTDMGRAALGSLDAGEEYQHIVDFYNSLDPLPDYMDLWNYIAKHDPVILTGMPHGNWADKQKRKWVAREINPHVKVITCMSRDKVNAALDHMGTTNLNGAILIDDRPKEENVKSWKDADGVWVTHTSAENTIAQLKKMGI